MTVQARERRDGVNKGYDEQELQSTTADYRAIIISTNIIIYFSNIWCYNGR